MLEFTGLICLTYLLIHAEPVQSIKRFLMLSPETKVEQLSGYPYDFHRTMITLFNCAMCLGFWVGLAYYHEILMACCVSLSAEVLNILMSRLNRYL